MSLEDIITIRLVNVRTNAKAVGKETESGKMFQGKAELLESILEEYEGLT